MKYNQYLELKEVLYHKNIEINEVKNNPDTLNEAIGLLGLIGGILVGLTGLGAIFGKSLLRLGIKKFYVNKILKISNKFKEDMLQKIRNLVSTNVNIRKDIIEKYKSLKDSDTEEAKGELQILSNQKLEIEKRLSKIISEFIDKYATSKSSEIYEKIDELKKLKNSQKLALKTLWDTNIAQIKAEALAEQMKNGTITDKSLINNFKKETEKTVADTKQRMQDYMNQTKQQSKQPQQKQNVQQKTNDPKQEDKSRLKQSVLNQDDNL